MFAITAAYGEHVVQYFNSKEMENKPKIQIIALEDGYVEHGIVDILKKNMGLDAESVVKRIVANYVRK